MANQHSIGAVTFFLPEGEQSPRFKPGCGYHPRDAQLSGNERIAALRAAYRREPIPGGLVMFVYGVGQIGWETVYWETAGDRVTFGKGDKRRLLTEQLDDDEHGEPRTTRAGELVEIISVDKTNPDNPYHVGCPATGGNWFFSEAELFSETEPA